MKTLQAIYACALLRILVKLGGVSCKSGINSWLPTCNAKGLWEGRIPLCWPLRACTWSNENPPD